MAKKKCLYITILCHVVFFLFSSCLNIISKINTLIIKTKPFKVTTYKKYDGHLCQSGRRLKSVSLFYLCY